MVRYRHSRGQRFGASGPTSSLRRTSVMFAAAAVTATTPVTAATAVTDRRTRMTAAAMTHCGDD